MAHDVFISYAHADREIADLVCAEAEARGIRCWIAPRNIAAGADWGGAIVAAIRASRLMVLVFSSHANASRHVPREIERAIDLAIPVIPFRIEDVTPNGALEYGLSSVHWFDAAAPPMQPHAARLADALRDRLGVGAEAAAAAAAPVSTSMSAAAAPISVPPTVAGAKEPALRPAAAQSRATTRAASDAGPAARRSPRMVLAAMVVAAVLIAGGYFYFSSSRAAAPKPADTAAPPAIAAGTSPAASSPSASPPSSSSGAPVEPYVGSTPPHPSPPAAAPAAPVSRQTGPAPGDNAPDKRTPPPVTKAAVERPASNAAPAKDAATVAKCARLMERAQLESLSADDQEFLTRRCRD